MTPTCPSYLLLLAHSTLNAGDAALLAVTVQSLRERHPGARIAVVSDYPAEPGLAALEVEPLPSPAALARAPSPGGGARLLSAFRRADLALALPGNPFFSTGRFGKPFYLGLAQLLLAQAARLPLVVLPQTIGPFTRPWEARLLAGLYRRARRVWLRDALSLRLAQAWGLADARYAPDPSFTLAPAPPDEARAVLRRAGVDPRVPFLGVTVHPRMTRAIDPAALQAAQGALARALADVQAESGLPLVFFAQSTGPAPCEDDRRAARAVGAALAQAGSRATFVDPPLPPALLKACYGQAGALLASRMHAGLFALGAGVPACFIGYLSKTRGVLESLGLDEWGLDLADATHQRLRTALRALLADLPARRALLAARLPAWSAAARQPFADL